VQSLLNPFSGLSLRSNPGLKLANAFGVFVYKIQPDALSGLPLAIKPAAWCRGCGKRGRESSRDRRHELGFEIGLQLEQ